MRFLRSFGPNAPLNALRCWSVRAQGYSVGDAVYLGEGFVISDELQFGSGERLTIGDRAAIAQRVIFVLSSHPNNSRLRQTFAPDRRSVRVGRDAWIGAGAILLPGADVGESAVVGAGSVVTRPVPPRTVAAGVPAKVIRELDLPPEN